LRKCIIITEFSYSALKITNRHSKEHLLDVSNGKYCVNMDLEGEACNEPYLKEGDLEAYWAK